jgi:signal transduction histidine kinase
MRVFLNYVKIKAKLAFVVAICGTALIATTMLGTSVLHQRMMVDRQEQTRRIVQVARSVVLGWYDQMRSAGLSTEKAQSGAIAALRAIRYGNNDYIFIQGYDGATVLNPNRPDLEGVSRPNATDPDGVPVMKLEIEAAKNGGGFVRYRFTRGPSADLIPKLSYMLGFDPWQWAIGSGTYIDDIEADFRSSLLEVSGIALSIFAIAMLAAYFVHQNVATSLLVLRDKMIKLADGDLGVDLAEVDRRDEVGEMADAMRVFKENAEAAQLLEAEREKRRELEYAMNHADRVDSLGRLASGIAHDLNNALVPVLAMTKSVMLRQAKGSREYANLDLALMGAQRARELVQQILAFGRKQAIEYRDFDVAQVVNDGIRMLRAVLPSTIRLESAVEPIPAIHGDAGQINQVLVNLVTNSSHAIGDEPGTITVTVSKEDEVYIRLSVADNGCGMDEKTAARLFEPFFTTKEAGKGTGLGLSVVRGIVTSHGGTIAVKSTPGHGTRFDVLLPIAQRAAPATLLDAARLIASG